MKGIVHWDDVETWDLRRGPMQLDRIDLGDAAESVNLGVARLKLDPGGRSSPVHVELDEEEIFYVLGGSGLSWQDGNSLVYEMRDGGHIQNLLAGRVPPPMEAESGRGLLMVNLLCDLVQVKTGPSGTAIRLWMTLPPQG